MFLPYDDCGGVSISFLVNEFHNTIDTSVFTILNTNCEISIL